jgi:D-sedoheptulose 7-phosphate isomerase
MNIKEYTFDYFFNLQALIYKLELPALHELVQMVWEAYKRDSAIYFIGNGGSASTATHLAADIGKNTIVDYKNKDEKRFRVHALTDNPAWIMALGNDISYEDIFVEQLRNFARKEDVLIAISGSGNSANVVKSAKFAKEAGMYTIGLVGFDGGKLMKMVDLPILVPSNHYGYIEGIHSEIHHFLVESLKMLKKEEKNG